MPGSSRCESVGARAAAAAWRGGAAAAMAHTSAAGGTVSPPPRPTHRCYSLRCCAQTIFALVTSVVPWLKKDVADEELYEGAFAVLDSLDAMRSCCLLAELTNNAFAAHASKPEAQLLDLVNALFDMLWWVARANAAAAFWHAHCFRRRSRHLASPPPLSSAASRRPRHSRSAPCTSSATWWTS